MKYESVRALTEYVRIISLLVVEINVLQFVSPLRQAWSAADVADSAAQLRAQQRAHRCGPRPKFFIRHRVVPTLGWLPCAEHQLLAALARCPLAFPSHGADPSTQYRSNNLSQAP